MLHLAAALPLTLFFAAAPLDELAPLEGSLVLAAEGDVSDVVRSAFVKLAGGGAADIVVFGASKPGKKALGEWIEAGARDALALQAKKPRALMDEELLGRLLTADGIWLEDVPEPVASSPFVRQLLENALERGAAVGAAGDDARLLTSDDDGSALGFLPSVSLVMGAAAKEDDANQHAARKRPGRLVVSLPHGTGVAVHHGRRVAVFGKRDVGFAVARKDGEDASVVREHVVSGKEQRGLHDRMRYEIDLLAWVRTARAAAAAPFPAAEPETPRLGKGALVISGGGGVTKETFERFLELAGGDDARIVCIPSASTRTDREPDSYSAGKLEEMGASVVYMHVPDRASGVSDARFAQNLKEATGVWIDGGRTYRFMDLFEDTALEEEIHALMARGGVVGGSSAGAQVIGEMLVRGDPRTNKTMLDVGYLRGLGLLPGVVVDAHFRERGRTKSFGALVAKHPQLLGFGVDEDTSLVVVGQVGEVLGEGGVSFFAGKAEPLVVESGGRYDLVERDILN